MLWYVDPRIPTTAESNQYDGGFGMGKLRDAWGDVTWTPGDNGFQARNSLRINPLQIMGSGAPGAPITIRPYGEGDYAPRIDAADGAGCIYAIGRSYIDIEGFEGYGATVFPGALGHFVNCHHIRLAGCRGHSNHYGLRLDNTGATDLAEFLLEDNVCEDSMQQGLSIVTGTAPGGTITNPIVRRNTFKRSGVVGPGQYGVHVATRLAVDAAYDASRVVHNLTFDDNIVDVAYAYGAAFRGVTGGRANGNTITRSGYALNKDAHAFWFGGCLDMDIAHNDIHDNAGWINGPHGSGVAIFLDQMSNPTGYGTQRCRVFANHIYNQGKFPTAISSEGFPSAAICVYRSQDNTIESNLIHDCRHGIAILGAGSFNSERNAVIGNTCRDIEGFAIAVSSRADATTLRHNVVHRAGIGYFVDDNVTQVVREGNAAFDCARAWGKGSPVAVVEGVAG